jgi:hypothetical protein
MTADNQTFSTIEETTYSKAATFNRTTTKKAAPLSLKTLSLRPTKSVKKINSFKPLAAKRLK